MGGIMTVLSERNRKLAGRLQSTAGKWGQEDMAGIRGVVLRFHLPAIDRFKIQPKVKVLRWRLARSIDSI
jgi:hypothetical protein